MEYSGLEIEGLGIEYFGIPGGPLADFGGDFWSLLVAVSAPLLPNGCIGLVALRGLSSL